MPPSVDDTKPEASKSPTKAAAAAPAPKAGDTVLFWPERKPFIQHSFEAVIVQIDGPTAQLTVTNHETGRTFNVNACAFSETPAPGAWGLPKKLDETA